MALSLFVTLLGAGLVWALAVTSTAEVQSGYFRSCVLVVMGLIIVALLSGWSEMTSGQAAILISATVGCYGAFIGFSLERLAAAKNFLWIISALLLGAIVFRTEGPSTQSAGYTLASDLVGAGLLGVSMAAMLLGHYYLTAPWMSLAPLKRLVLGIVAASGARAGIELCRVFGTGFVDPVVLDQTMDWIFYVGFIWLVGVAGPIVLAILTWQTLKIKATQAATGILYVIVIFTLIGEVTGVAMRILGGSNFD